LDKKMYSEVLFDVADRRGAGVPQSNVRTNLPNGLAPDDGDDPVEAAQRARLTAAPDKGIALDFLAQTHGDRPRHLVAINPEGGPPISKTFEAGETASLCQWLAKMNDKRHWGIYYHVNELGPDCRDQRAKKVDIVSAHFLHVDVDDAGAKDTIKTFNPAPTVTVFSGGGFNCLWSIEPTIKRPSRLSTRRSHQR
jgi:hypothetical protein